MPKKGLILLNHVQFYSKGPNSQEPSRGPILQAEWLNLIAMERIPKSQAQAHRKRPDSQDPGSIPQIRDPVARNQAQSHEET